MSLQGAGPGGVCVWGRQGPFEGRGGLCHSSPSGDGQGGHGDHTGLTQGAAGQAGGGAGEHRESSGWVLWRLQRGSSPGAPEV